MWRAVQGSYGNLVTMMTSMQAELRDLKRGAGITAASSGTTVGEKQARSRTQFKPLLRPEEESEVGSATNPMGSMQLSGSPTSASLATFRGPAVGAHIKGMKRRASAGIPSALAGSVRTANAAAGAAGAEEGIQMVGLLPGATTADVRPRGGPADGVRSARLTTFNGSDESAGDVAEGKFAGATSPRDAAAANEHLLLAARP